MKKHLMYFLFLLTKQGCVVSPALFSILFSSILVDAFHDVNSGASRAFMEKQRLLMQPPGTCYFLMTARSLEEIKVIVNQFVETCR